MGGCWESLRSGQKASTREEGATAEETLEHEAMLTRMVAEMQGRAGRPTKAHKRRTMYREDAMPSTTKPDLSKSARFHVRATSKQAELIRAGASRRGVKLTDYIVDSLCAQAEMDLADQNHFLLPKDKWDAFLKALDAPPRVPPGLKRLFSRPSLAESR